MKKIRKKWGDKIYVEWRDANSESGWVTYDDAMKITKDDYLCKTNAFYIGESGGFLIVAHTITTKQEFDITGVQRIPLTWIIKAV